MHSPNSLFTIILFGHLSSALGAAAQELPNALPDKPVSVKSQDAARKIEEAIKPYVRKAKKTYPKAKARFLKGLPPQYTFFITTKITEGPKYEVVFISVKKISNNRIYGLIWNDLSTLKNYKHGDEYDLSEQNIIDWTIRRPDGSEEGNFVGNFLDTYHPQ